MLQRERQRGVRLGIELEADALLSISGVQAYSIGPAHNTIAKVTVWAFTVPCLFQRGLTH